MLGSSLARMLGLPAPPVAVINVRKEFIRHSEEMVVHLERDSEPCHAGLSCGVEFNERGFIFLPNFFPPEDVENPADILGMLIFDKWTSNSDRRQLILYRETPTELYRIAMIDQGDCFCRDRWAFVDDPVIGLSDCRRFYGRATTLRDFEPWLYRLENEVKLDRLREIAARIPPQWYQGDTVALKRLLIELDCRRVLVRGLLSITLRTCVDYFPRVMLTRTA